MFKCFFRFFSIQFYLSIQPSIRSRRRIWIFRSVYSWKSASEKNWWFRQKICFFLVIHTVFVCVTTTTTTWTLILFIKKNKSFFSSIKQFSMNFKKKERWWPPWRSSFIKVVAFFLFLNLIDWNIRKKTKIYSQNSFESKQTKISLEMIINQWIWINKKKHIRMAPSAIANETAMAMTGSPCLLTYCNGSKNGIIWSLAIACNNRGAPTNDCNAAPKVDNSAPAKIIVGCGHEINVTYENHNHNINEYILFILQ